MQVMLVFRLEPREPILGLTFKGFINFTHHGSIIRDARLIGGEIVNDAGTEVAWLHHKTTESEWRYLSM